MNHWNLFKQAWRFFWRNPALWVFGLLAALGGGYSWNYSMNFGDMRAFGAMPFEARAILREMFSSTTLNTLFVIGLVWAVIAFILATFAQGAMINMVSEMDAGGKPGVGAGVRAGARRFLPLLAVRFILALPTLLIGLVTASMALSTVSNLLNDTGPSLADIRGLGITAALGTVSFLLGVLMVGIGVSAERAVVLEDQPIMPSLARGWKLLWSKLGDYIVIVVLFIAVGLVAGLIFACILIPVLCAFIGGGIGSAVSVQRDNPLLIATLFVGPAVIVAVLLSLIFGTLVTVFTSGVWTLAYRQWRADFFNPQLPATGLQPPEPVPPIGPLTSSSPIDNPPPTDSTPNS